jgi:hypothetical protein
MRAEPCPHRRKQLAITTIASNPVTCRPLSALFATVEAVDALALRVAVEPEPLPSLDGLEDLVVIAARLVESPFGEFGTPE